MAYDEGLAELIRGELAEESGLTEKRMFGGLCLLIHGHMIAGVHQGGAMFRVGKENEAAARAIPGSGPMTFTGKPMAGYIEVTEEALADDDRRAAWTGMALAYVKSLPPK